MNSRNKPDVTPIVQAIVDFHKGDTEKVLAFYTVADEKLWDTSPEINAVLEGVDTWLVANRMMKGVPEPTLEEILTWDDWEGAL
ncbi:MAG: hypothetical protein IT324_34190 [Anaerolineae bacterium]|nr:hypothetical protein [Anaerolineae bacterium]